MTDTQWARLQPLLPPQRRGKGTKGGRPRNDDRQTINGILWILRTGAPWDDLPERYGKRSTVSTRSYRWIEQGIWDRIYVERLINRLKQFRRLATRYEKRGKSYHAMWVIAATLLWL